ncbi:MAG: phage tail tape measure protein [Clostridia bacterium]|nr:phage tail tape measure protein [Clostridia bacterium]
MANRYIDAILRFRDQFTGEMAQSVGKISEQEKHLKAVSGRLTKIGRGFTNAGKTLTAGVTTPIVGFAAASVKTAAEFEASMSKVQSICGASGEALEQLTAKAQEMGAKTKFSASESAEAFSYMAMAGWKTEDMLDGIEGIMYLAGATGQDLASTSDIVTDALTAFGLTAGDTGHFVDVLAKTASNANTDVAKMGETFKYVAPVAGTLGYSVEDMSLAIGLMANNGVKASSAGTALRAMLSNMASPSKKAKAAMDELGISMTDASGEMKPLNVLMGELRGKFANLTEAQKVQYATAIAGKNASTGMLAIVNASTKDYESLTGAIGDCTGAAKDMYDVANDNLQGQLTVLKSTLESIMITVGNKLMPVIKNITDKIQTWAEKLNGLNDSQVETIMKIAGVVALVGPALLVVGKVITTAGKVVRTIGTIKKAISSVMGVFSAANPTVLIVVAGVALLAGAAFLVYKNWDKIKPKVTEVVTKLKDFGAKCKDIFFKVKDWFFKTFGPIADALGTGQQKVRDFLQKCRDFVERNMSAVTGKIDSFRQKIKDFNDKVKDFTQKTADFLREKKDRFVEKIRSVVETIRGVYEKIRDIGGKIKDFFGGIISWVQTTFSEGWRKAWEGVKSIFSTVFSTLGEIFKKPINAVISLINKAIDGLNSIKVDIPDFVPWVGGNSYGLSLPHVPTLAKGTKDFVGGAAVINERGGELVNLPRGAQVIPHDQSVTQAVGLGERIAARGVEGQLIRLTDVLRAREQRALPALRAAQALPTGGQKAAGGNSVRNITIAKIADTVVVKEQADADALAETIAQKLEELAENIA